MPLLPPQFLMMVKLDINNSLPPEMTLRGGTEEVSKNVRRWIKLLQDENFKSIIKVAIENGDNNQALVDRLFEGWLTDKSLISPNLGGSLKLN